MRVNMQNNIFKNRIGIGNISFSNDLIDLVIKHEVIHSKEIQTIGFFLANMIVYESIPGKTSMCKREITIDKVDDDIYTIKSQLSLNMDFMSRRITLDSGKGVVYKLTNGYEIIYNEGKKKYHYKFIANKLDNEGKLIEAINCIDKKIMECYLVDDSFEIKDATNKQLGGKGFKTLFKYKY